MNEFVGIDEEGLYIDLGPEHPLPPPSSQCQAGNNNEFVGSDACSESDDDSLSNDDDSEVEDTNDIVKDKEDELMPDVDYDKNDPPMIKGTVYSNMDAFKIALASHAVKYEFSYDIEKSDPERYRVSCLFKSEGCRWRIHAATLPDGVRVKVISNSTIYSLYFWIILDYVWAVFGLTECISGLICRLRETHILIINCFVRALECVKFVLG
jgi:hypothetical protein